MKIRWRKALFETPKTRTLRPLLQRAEGRACNSNDQSQPEFFHGGGYYGFLTRKGRGKTKAAILDLKRFGIYI